MTKRAAVYTGFDINPEKCTECQRCMAECSFVKTEKIRIVDSRISVRLNWPDEPDINVCRFDECLDKPCIGSCPTGAVFSRKSLVLIDGAECTGCGACVDICPFNAIWLDAEGLAFKCDFCDGDPACVRECVTEAITARGL